METTPNEKVELRDEYRLGEERRSAMLLLAGVGLTGLILSLVVSTGDMQRFAFSYLLNFCYFLSFSLGALCFVIVSHLTKAGWNVTWRRLAEVMAGTLPLLAVLFIPILAIVLFSRGTLFYWNDLEAIEHDELVLKKVAYLNSTFFTIRAVGYFLIWGMLARFFYNNSRRQDQSGDKALSLRMQKWSGPSIMLFGMSLTFASFDWMMSLNPHWFSTIFGVYYFAGCAVGFFAALILAAQFLQARGLLKESITVEHYHDLGKLLFGFVFFWGYIAFSQYMLIWYANIPEETGWYLIRQTGGWLGIALLLLFGHFLIPFPGLLSRHVRRNRMAMAFWSVLLLAMHWVDLYYLIMPQLHRYWLHMPAPGTGGPVFGLVDLFGLVGMGAIYLAALIWVAGDRPLIALRDPRLAESLAFKNV